MKTIILLIVLGSIFSFVFGYLFSVLMLRRYIKSLKKGVLKWKEDVNENTINGYLIALNQIENLI